MTRDDSPFGTPSGGARRVLRWSVYAVVPLVALLGVLLFRRRAEPPAPAVAGHDHAAMTDSDSARPVMLSADAARRIGVSFTTVTRGALVKEVRTVGQVTFDETRVTTISLRVDGWVERLHVDYTGMPVRVGDPILDLYSPMLVAAQEELLLAARLARDAAGGTEEARRGAAELVQSSRRRLQQWNLPDGDLERLEASGTVPRTTTLRSSVNGVVVEKNVFAGQQVMAGAPLYRVADLDVVWIEGEVFEQDLSSVRLGLTVTAELEAFPGEQFAGRISYVYPTLTTDTRTARVRVVMANPRLRLKPGMYATLRFASESRANVLTLPRSAVLSTGERSLVFVKLPDGQLAPRAIQVGVTGQDRIEVLAGLAAGDIVVASATFLIDAESNLGSALGSMPGMDMSPATPAAPARVPKPPPKDSMPAMPGMDHTRPPR